jgi:undecaprenyl diphosphate synthase
MNKTPLHIAIIMDGNGRWAAAKNKPRSAGHEAGVKALEKVIKKAKELGVKYLTLYAFSTENWTRPESEIKTLMTLLSKALDVYFKELPAENARLLISGRRAPLPQNLLDKMDAVAERTKNNDGLTINLALNYGGRQEITDAVNKFLAAGGKELKDGGLAEYMYQPLLPEPELIIRTSGERRISNFLLWQSAYSEFYFTEVLWPDFDGEELEKAVKEYSARVRRFGGV